MPNNYYRSIVEHYKSRPRPMPNKFALNYPLKVDYRLISAFSKSSTPHSESERKTGPGVIAMDPKLIDESHETAASKIPKEALETVSTLNGVTIQGS